MDDRLQSPTNTTGPHKLVPGTGSLAEGLLHAVEGRVRQASQDDSTWEISFLLPSTYPGSLGRLGNCEVLARLGQGGMGIVFEGFDVNLQRKVAIKVMHLHLASSEQNRRRFLREARTAAGINHPNVVTVHSVDEQKGMPYLVMEFIGGTTLAAHLGKGKRLPEETIVRVGLQIASGLGAAHRRGIIHRDIKPANVMLAEQLDQVKITDFGLALPTLEESQITVDGQVIGTPAYMSPEQVNGDKLDPRSDLFSLGCVLYAMAAGKSPFHGTHHLDVARKIRETTPKPLCEIAPGTSPHLSGAIERLLAKNPADRWQSADEVGRVLAGQPVRRKRRRLVGRVAVGILVLAIAFGGVWAGRHAFAPSEGAVQAVLPRTLTISHKGPADFQTLESALANAGPGDTLRILDDGTYEEFLEFDRPERQRGLTLVGDNGPTLVAPAEKQTALLIRDSREITVRGLRFVAAAAQHCIIVRGNASGLRLDGLTCVHPDDSQWAHISLDKTWGEPEKPIRVENSTFDRGELGIVLASDGAMRTAYVVLDKNRFRGKGMHIVLSRGVEEVAIQRNIFIGGTGIGMNLAEVELPTKIRIDGNSFFQNFEWMRLLGAGRLTRDVTVANNLLIDVEGITLQGLTVEELTATWSFHHNWWEPAAKTAANQVRLVAELKNDVRLLSRDPAHPDFLRPPAGSPLASAGRDDAGQRFLGALPPAGGGSRP